MLTIFWLVLVAIMLVIEIFTLGLTTIWFSLGGVAAAIAAGLNSPLWLQIVLFAGVSVVVMGLVRPFAVKVLDKSRARNGGMLWEMKWRLAWYQLLLLRL